MAKQRKNLCTEELLPPYTVPIVTLAELTRQSHTLSMIMGLPCQHFQSEPLTLKSAVTARHFSSSTYLH